MNHVARATRALIEELHRQGKARGVTVEDNGASAQVDGAFPVEPLCRAVIAAIRDVDAGSPAALVAGKSALYSCSEDPELSDARGCWQAMIDKMLEDRAR